MKELFLYTYYRIVRYYKKWEGWIGWDPEGMGMMALLASISYYTTSILVIILHFYKHEPSRNILIMIWGGAAIVGMFLGSEKLYNELEQKYKNETNRILKGWLVSIFIMGSVLSLFICWFL